MTREEEIKRFVHNYIEENYKGDSYEAYAEKEDIAKACVDSIKWADQHPRKGLWDSEKVIEWIKNNFSCSGHGFPLHYNHVSYQPEDIIRDLRKVMEE